MPIVLALIMRRRMALNNRLTSEDGTNTRWLMNVILPMITLCSGGRIGILTASLCRKAISLNPTDGLPGGGLGGATGATGLLRRERTAEALTLALVLLASSARRITARCALNPISLRSVSATATKSAPDVVGESSSAGIGSPKSLPAVVIS